MEDNDVKHNEKSLKFPTDNYGALKFSYKLLLFVIFILIQGCFFTAFRKTAQGGEINIDWLPPICAQTWDGTHWDLGLNLQPLQVTERCCNQLSHTGQGIG